MKTTIAALLLFAAPAYAQIDRPDDLHDPGSGWSGAWTAQDVGAGGEVPIAHWDRMPDQILFRGSETAFELGVIAYHHNGIDKVEVSNEDGTVLDLDTWYVNDDTGYASFSFVIKEADLTDGEAYEIRARVIPNTAGTERILTWTMLDGGGLSYETRYVDAGSGSDGNTGKIPTRPFETMIKAFQDIESSTAASGFAVGDGAIIYLKGDAATAADEVFVTNGGDTTWEIDNDWPLTIKYYSTDDPVVRLYKEHTSTQNANDAPYENVTRLLWEGVTFDYSDSANHIRINPNAPNYGDGTVYILDCHLEGTTDLVTSGKNLANIAHPTSYLEELGDSFRVRLYVADTSFAGVSALNILNANVWTRGVTFDGCRDQTFRSQCTIDVTATDTHYGTGSWDTMFHSSDEEAGAWANTLCDGLRVYDHYATDTVMRVQVQNTAANESTNANVAIVNSIFEFAGTTTPGHVYLWALSGGWQDLDHVLLLNNTFYDAEVSVQASGSVDLANSVVRNCIFESLYFDGSTIANLTFHGVAFDTDWMACDDQSNITASNTWVDETNETTIVDGNGPTYNWKVASGSNAKNHTTLSGLDVKFDQQSNERGNGASPEKTSVGATKAVGE